MFPTVSLKRTNRKGRSYEKETLKRKIPYHKFESENVHYGQLMGSRHHMRTEKLFCREPETYFGFWRRILHREKSWDKWVILNFRSIIHLFWQRFYSFQRKYRVSKKKFLCPIKTFHLTKKEPNKTQQNKQVLGDFLYWTLKRVFGTPVSQQHFPPESSTTVENMGWVSSKIESVPPPIRRKKSIRHSNRWASEAKNCNICWKFLWNARKMRKGKEEMKRVCPS